MKKSDELRIKTRKMIAKNLIILVALAVVAFVGAFSWFSQNTKATAEGITAKTELPDGLEIAIVAPNSSPQNDDFTSSTITLTSDDTQFAFLKNLTLSEITGDGGINPFQKPPIVQDSSVAKVNTAAEASLWKNAVANTDYICFDLYMRAKSENRTVSLKNNTYFGPVDPNANFGNTVAGWSPDSVIGAARMSILDSASQSRKLLWVPAPHLYYNGDVLDTNVTDITNTFGLQTKDESGNTKVINSWGTYNHGYYLNPTSSSSIPYSADPNDVGTKVTAGVNNDYKLPYDVTLAQLNTVVKYGEDDYYQNKVRVNIWIEGEDTEARALQVGGNFKVVFEFGMI